MITKELIENRIHNFWGYGNLKSDIWFIGMEEGFHGDLDDLEIRFEQTRNRSVIDLCDDMIDVKDHMRFFGVPTPIQSTWGKLIFILLSLNGKNPSNEQIREYQREKFGRLKSDHCILEFMPLPCQSTRREHWKHYDKLGIDYLINRQSYLAKVMPSRINLFRELIIKHRPKIVICYSLTYLHKWKEIIGNDVKKIGTIYFSKNNKTNFFIIPHSVARGMTSADWAKIAETIKNLTT